MFISVALEKAFNKTQHSYMTKVLKTLQIKEMCLIILWVMYDPPIANIVQNKQILKPFFLQSGIRTMLNTLLTFNH
jgi:hypothetical protein